MDPKTSRIFAPRGDGSKKKQILVLITTRADGKVMKLCIIYSYKRAVPKAIVDAVPAGFYIARSDSGCSKVLLLKQSCTTQLKSATSRCF